VLAPFAMKAIVKELETARSITVIIDSANHNHLKVVPVLVKYFVPNLGIKVKITEFSNLGCETAETQAAYIMKILKKYDLLDKVTALSADNTNTNFGGAKRKGRNNVLWKLGQKIDKQLIGTRCGSHVLHNSIQPAADSLPVDFEDIPLLQYIHHQDRVMD
jgi:hypothetical protein